MNESESVGAIWLLLPATMAMLMHVGFAMVTVGLGRAKNASHTVAMNLIIVPVTGLAFWAFGFALLAGSALRARNMDPNGLFELTEGKNFLQTLLGTQGFFLSGVEQSQVLIAFLWSAVLAQMSASIPIGAMAERWRWKNFCLYGLWFVVPYALFAHWSTTGGWLALAGLWWHLGHGAVDLAGSGWIHMMGGMTALVGCWMIGPRTLKYRGNRPQPLPGHHLPMLVLGSLLMAACWPLINAALVSDPFRGVAAVNTVLAGFAATLGAMLAIWRKRMRPDPTLLCNGLIAGLVAISAGCGCVETWAAVVIGLVAGGLVVAGVIFFERHGLDDPAGVISVHGLGGLWGLVAVGLFASGKYRPGLFGDPVYRDEFVMRYGADGVRGLFYGDPSQLLAQWLAVFVLAFFSIGIAWLAFYISNRITPLRVSRDVELEGLDGPEMGALGYPDFPLTRHA